MQEVRVLILKNTLNEEAWSIRRDENIEFLIWRSELERHSRK
jgi:hypothetical protein